MLGTTCVLDVLTFLISLSGCYKPEKMCIDQFNLCKCSVDVDFSVHLHYFLQILFTII